ncbi:hypothetical protein TBLA_0I01660 [Henningerozyma blattae CBS 6284]|uniref:Kinetochore protein NDC80 n=1 Tax=Henningerozyma blattae (strain ATCC 34711 / CBS 6284 / DSM 70876 / NBRC 10599 / NRRL Y-10934 / UCD 77-7) TaxID=1071380 RepID=I2H8X2_HENB6|nr:hypothetical protein TBLA_0I01660 [Tetrapisispora blattae CBS 6284]CCH62824.1 hypothetical protein TBLA_0I01660 [Tetrapisispora blattae CBS 6284]
MDRVTKPSQIPKISQFSSGRSATDQGLTNMINDSIARNTSKSAGYTKNTKNRMTLAGTGPVTSSRRSSAGSKVLRNSLPPLSNPITASTYNNSLLPRTSNFRSTSNNSGSNNTMFSSSTSVRDPRPLRDKEFQNRLIDEIYGYLKENRFDIETTMPISLNTVRQPTQKAFVTIFKWLYNKIDPGYRFSPSIEDDVYPLLKILRYPYISSITKSQISAAGGTGWSKFLGMLHWLIQLNRSLGNTMNIIHELIDEDSNLESSIINKSLINLNQLEERQDSYENLLENIFTNYIINSYKEFLNGNDDDKQFDEQFENDINILLTCIQNDIKNLERINSENSKNFNVLDELNNKLQNETEKNIALKDDVKRFEKYIYGMQNRREDNQSKLTKMQNSKNEKESEIKLLNDELATLETQLQEKGLSASYIDEKLKEIKVLETSINTKSEEMDKLVTSIKSLKIESDNIYTVFIETTTQYTNMLNSFNQSRISIGDEFNIDEFQLPIVEGFSQPDGTIGVTPENLFREEGYSATITKSKLNGLLSIIQNRITVKEKEIENLKIKVENLEKKREEKHILSRELELELSQLKSQYEIDKQNFETELLSQQIEIEKIETKILDAKRSMNTRRKEAEYSLQELEQQHENTIHEFEDRRHELHQRVIEVIDFVSKFKMYVQNSVDNLEKITLEELQRIKINQPNTPTTEGNKSLMDDNNQGITDGTPNNSNSNN